ncbi:MAG TPA: DUF3106 domain-containing protein [Usitatibacter sp.]|nr:DUF3106 domain-containing protein [Usitatibacter sp.]
MARQIAALIAAAALAAFAGLAHAETSRGAPQRAWSSLSPQEQRILGPVAPEWDRLPGFQQERLISSARRYPSLQPIQKERFDERIRDWATMTPEQRRAARETYKGLSRLPPEKQHELRQRWLQRHGDEDSRGQPARRGERPGPR